MNDPTGKQPELVRWRAFPPAGGNAVEALNWMQTVAAPDYAYTDSVASFRGDSAIIANRVHQVRDYFESIEIEPQCILDRCAYELRFHPKSDVGGFWKDAMLLIVRALKEKGFELTLASVERSGNARDAVVSGGK